MKELKNTDTATPKIPLDVEQTINNFNTGKLLGKNISLKTQKLRNDGIIKADNIVKIIAEEVVGTGKIEGVIINFTSLNEEPVHVSNTMQLSGEVTGTYIVGEFPE